MPTPLVKHLTARIVKHRITTSTKAIAAITKRLEYHQARIKDAQRRCPHPAWEELQETVGISSYVTYKRCTTCGRLL